ncbi:hypothetical protein FQN60_004904 [Etheostoma spectabile]|uniref:Rho-GAP domain-containing protein n=1 Tax=Etheostoma spectabile TaxID=54343 RepID=A0A5J5DLI1_9PERO|nr:hypothetical protein FQN60_004904 [Etheostoma spectabile]
MIVRDPRVCLGRLGFCSAMLTTCFLVEKLSAVPSNVRGGRGSGVEQRARFQSGSIMEAGCVVAAVIENAASGPQGEPGSGDVLEGYVIPSADLDKDDALLQATNNNPSEETSTAMVRSDDITEHPAEPLLRSCVSTASMKVKNMKKLTFPRGHFPRLEECAHFHYETVDFGNVQLEFAEGQSEGPKAGLDSKELVFLIQITCQARNWLVKRTYEDFRVLDKHLHLCIYDRRYSHLTELPRYDTLKDTVETVTKMLATYLSRFSAIADNKINCGPVLTWMEEASINVPAIAAAHVTKRYTAQATDELTFEVGDIVSVIDMPPKEDTGWWRGKHGFQVGFFPCDCVELINDKIPPSVQSSVPKPVCKKHGKLVTFLRTFMKSRPPPQKLRQRGILRERVFGCDLGEHLHNSGHEVPQVVKSCADFIEKNGVFDSEQIPDLTREVFRQDIHSVGSLCKLYFRELPNPLLTYQLYGRFSEAVSAATDEERLVKIHNVIQQLPPPHYRTLEYLMRHLSHLATFSPITNMHTKNLAIVWAPNLLRSRQIESACFSGTAAFMEVRIQSVVVDDYIEVGEGPGALLGKFHTSHSVSKRKLKRHPSEPNEIKSIALPGEPPSYRSRRPRSTSEAVSGICRDDVRNTRSKDNHRTHPLNGSHNGADHVRTAACISPPHQEDDIDLCPPAAGIYSLDFDPMSFQCSPPSATPGLQHKNDGNKWRKSTGCPGESEPIASPNNNIRGYQSPDISPALGKGGKKVTSKPLSPKLRKKSFKTQADVQNASASPPPLPSSSPPVERCEARLADGKEPRAPYPHCSPISTASQGSALTDLSQSAQNLPDPGTDRLMSSVSVLPPHPPLTSAARKLALALAESAQKASSDSQRRNNVPSHAQDRPPRPSVLDLKGYPQEYPHASQWQTSAHSPVKSQRCPHLVHFRPAHPGSEPLQVIDRQESVGNFTPNVSPLGSESLDEGSTERRDRREEKEFIDTSQAEPTYQSVGVSTPTQPVCSSHSPSTSPVYVNTDSINVFNFRAVLAETSIPASVEEVIPRPLQPSSIHHYSPEEDRPWGLVEDIYSNHHHHHHHQPILTGRMPAPHCPRPDALPHHLLGRKSMYRQSSEGRYSTLGLRHPLSPQYRRSHRDEHLISGCHRQPGQWQRSEDRVVGHPAIRRAHSFHAPHISHYELAEAEVLPPDTMFYVEQTSSQEVPYDRLIQTGIHPVRQQFENTRADYRYSPYSEMNPVDVSGYYVEPCRQSSVRHSQSYTMRSTRESGQSDYYNYSPHHVPPVNRELYIESRDTVVYEARDADVLERVVYQPVKQESHSRRKNTHPAVSPYESPVSPTDTRNRDIMHTRSKSDPGNACLLSANRTESPNVGVAPSPTSQQAEHEVTRQQHGHRSSAEPRPFRRIQIKESSSRQPPLRKVPSLPERGCSNLKNMEHHNRSHTQAHDQDRFMMTNAVKYSGVVKPGILRRPGRSQSTRENRHYYHYQAKSSLDPEHLGSFSTQPNRRTQSTKVRPTQYGHNEGYYAAPRPKPTRSGKAAAGYMAGQGCMSPRGHGLLSKALGQEAFYHAALRSEAGVYD